MKAVVLLHSDIFLGGLRVESRPRSVEYDVGQGVESDKLAAVFGCRVEGGDLSSQITMGFYGDLSKLKTRGFSSERVGRRIKQNPSNRG